MYRRRGIEDFLTLTTFFWPEIQASLGQHLREINVAFLSIFTRAELKNIGFLTNSTRSISVINYKKLETQKQHFGV